MLKLHLEKVSFGYKICCLGAKSRYSYDKKLHFKKKNVLGYIILSKRSRFVSTKGLLLAVDCNQLFYWLSGGVKFSRLFKKFLWLFNDVILKV